MNLDGEQKELLRSVLLSSVCAAYPVAISCMALRLAAHAGGFSVGDEVIEQHMTYLVEKGLVEKQVSALSAAVNRFKATAAGVEMAESQHLI